MNDKITSTNNLKKREDHRTRLTKTMITEAMTSLLKEKPIQEITVKELCERADINRGTFYLHYHDIYDLLEQIENNILLYLEKLFQENAVVDYETEKTGQNSFISSLFVFFEKNRQLCSILLGEYGDSNFVSKVIEIGREKSVREYLELYPSATEEQANIFFVFIANGFLGLLRYGLQNDSIPFSTLAASAEKIIAEGTHFFNLTY